MAGAGSCRMLGVPGLSCQAHKQGVPVTVVVCTTALSPNLSQQLAIKILLAFIICILVGPGGWFFSHRLCFFFFFKKKKKNRKIGTMDCFFPYGAIFTGVTGPFALLPFGSASQLHLAWGPLPLHRPSTSCGAW